MTMRIGILVAVLGIVPALGRGAEYYAAPRPGSGSGTEADPFGLDDLPRVLAVGRALEVLQPGDTLYLKGGDYHLKGSKRGEEADAYNHGLICPVRSGTAEAPITIASAPGEVAHLYGGDANPVLGTMGRDNRPRNFLRFVGLTVHPNGYQPGIRIVRSEGIEIAYCRFLGQYMPTVDNHDGIRLDWAARTWIHHTEVAGVQGDGQNSCSVKMYFSSDTLIEDCYFHDCVSGVYDKRDNPRKILRRCVIMRCKPPYRGNETRGDGPCSATIEDCIVEGVPYLNGQCTDNQIHDNLIFGEAIAVGSLPNQTGLAFWNNVLLVPRGTEKVPKVKAIEIRGMPWKPPGEPGAAVVYLDYNLYASDAGPAPEVTYEFGVYAPPLKKFDSQSIKRVGLERHSRSVSGGRAALFERDRMRLRDRWATAGRDETRPGPDDIEGMLDLSRYGPEARPESKPATPAP